MVQYVFRHPAAPGEVFAGDAFDHSLGSEISFRIGEGDSAIVLPATVVAVSVASDGRSATFVVDVVDLPTEDRS